MKISNSGRKPIVRKSYNSVVDKSNNNSGEVLQLFPDARIYKTTLTKKFRERKKYKNPDIQEIKSIIPGEVISVDVTEGQSVKKGTQLMIFEAMKMHNIVMAPIDGIIEKIFVSERQKVAKGEVLIFIKASNKREDSDHERDKDPISSDGDLGLIV